MSKNRRQSAPRDRKRPFKVPEPPCTPKPPKVPPPPRPSDPFDKTIPDPRRIFKRGRFGLP
jgi:hypothetical protein